ncbi:nucleotidyltransferase domain-containing protein [Candidatus Woesearchaeota archaeon]|nr:nucleotidyltransferase domain-containing protein [Candidatus Woesearchaeota archaeon]
MALNLKNKLKEHFFRNPTGKFRVRTLERLLKMPLPSVIRYCKELEKELLIKEEIISGARFYSADRSSDKFTFEKRIFNLRLIHNSGIIKRINMEYSYPLLILFGSFSRGEDVESSDIDIFIETSENKMIDLRSYEKIFGKSLEVHKYKKLTSIKNKQLANNIINGAVLSGFMDIFR